MDEETDLGVSYGTRFGPSAALRRVGVGVEWPSSKDTGCAYCAQTLAPVSYFSHVVAPRV